MFFDYYYILWVLPAVIFAIWASARVSTTFQKYSAQLSHLGLSGSQAARKVLDASGVYQTKIEKTGGSLTDHYDPRTNIIGFPTVSVTGPPQQPSVWRPMRPATLSSMPRDIFPLKYGMPLYR